MGFFKNIMAPVVELATKTKFKIVNTSPQLMFVSGIALMTGGAVYGIYKAYADEGTVAFSVKDEFNEVDDLYGDRPREKFIPKAKAVGHCAWKVTKQQAIPMAMYGTGVVLTCGGFKKVAGLLTMAAGLAAETRQELDKFYKRVSDQFGEEEAEKLRYGLTQDVIETGTIDANGNITKKKEISYREDKDARGESSFRYILEELTMDMNWWSTDALINKARIMAVLGPQGTAVRRFKTRGWIFLDEILDEIGYTGDRSGKEHYWGWIDPTILPEEARAEYIGDGYISCGLFDRRILTDSQAAFMNGLEPNVTLEFNCDPKPIGNILTKYHLWS